MTRSALVTPSWLEDHLDDPAVVIAELRFEPDQDDYTSGHIVGAQWWDWKGMLWHPTDRQFADPAVIAQRLGARGIGPDTTLVLYSGRNHFAMYGYWVLHELLGHPDVRVLDGGRQRWLLDGRPLSTAQPAITPVAYQPQRARRDDSSRVSRDDVLANLRRQGRVLIDARSPEEFRGERVKPLPGFDHGAERRGHIPGARHLHGRDLVDPTDSMVKPPAELERLFRSVGAAPDQAREVIAYCRLSHRASAIWFTMTQVLGWRHVRIYDGSWTEWGSIVGVPVELPEA